MPEIEGGAATSPALIAVAGVPLLVESESRLVLELARRRYPAPDPHAEPVSRLRVHARGEPVSRADGPPDVAWRLHDDELVMQSRHLSARVDLERGLGEVVVSLPALANDASVRRALFEGVLYTLINRKDRHPIHAATLRLGDAALVLHGPSGVGKSTLAYVAHRAGIGVLSDDASRIQLEPELRVWGDGTPPRVHLLAGARDTFTELRDAPVERTGMGDEPKLVVDLQPPGDWTPYARRARVCLLSRAGGEQPRLRTAEAAEIHDALMNAPEAAMDLAPANRSRVLSALARPGGWHLALSSRPEEALPLLNQMLATVHGSAR